MFLFGSSCWLCQYLYDHARMFSHVLGEESLLAKTPLGWRRKLDKTLRLHNT